MNAYETGRRCELCTQREYDDRPLKTYRYYIDATRFLLCPECLAAMHRRKAEYEAGVP